MGTQTSSSAVYPKANNVYEFFNAYLEVQALSNCVVGWLVVLGLTAL